MFCSNCGKEILQGSKFCPICGSACEMPEQSTVQQEKTILTNAIPHSQKTPLLKVLKVLWIICNIITIITLFTGYNILIHIIQFLYF